MIDLALFFGSSTLFFGSATLGLAFFKGCRELRLGIQDLADAIENARASEGGIEQ